MGSTRLAVCLILIGVSLTGLGYCLEAKKPVKNSQCECKKLCDCVKCECK